jgi:predicted NBD/HSP70 family sugar kinase
MLKAPEVFHLAEKGDPFAIAVVEQHKKDLGKLLSQVNDVLNPDFIVLGGGVSLQRSIYEGLEEHLLAFSFVKKYCPKIYQNVLGDSAGVIGAALMVWSDD